MYAKEGSSFGGVLENKEKMPLRIKAKYVKKHKLIENIVRKARQSSSVDDIVSKHIASNPKRSININQEKASLPAPVVEESPLPPLPPKASETKLPETKQSVTKNFRIYENNVLVINPNIDASDKELYQRNGFRGAGKNLTSFLKNGDTPVFMKDVMIPEKFGLYTKDSSGTVQQVNKFQHQP